MLAPEHDTPTGQIADVELFAPYDDLDKVRQFARGVDVVTFEFENVPAATAAAAAEHALVRPSGRALEIAQHRIREKAFLVRHGLPVAPFAEVRTAHDLETAVSQVGRPSVLKTAALGYDGKGQARLDGGVDPHDAWRTLGEREAILERFVDSEREIRRSGPAASMEAGRTSDPSTTRIATTSSMCPLRHRMCGRPSPLRRSTRPRR